MAIFEIDIFGYFGSLHATLGGYNYSKPLEDGRNGFSHTPKMEMTCHMFLCPKNHLEVVFETAFGLWRPSI